MGILLKDVLANTTTCFVLIDAIDECSKSERKVLLKVLRDIMVHCSSVVKVFLAVRPGIVEEVKKICEFRYQATMSSSEADSNIITYIEDVLAKRTESGEFTVGDPNIVNEIRDALVQEANGMSVCPAESLLRLLTTTGFFG